MNKNSIYTGTNVTNSSTDILKETNLKSVFDSIVSPNDDLYRKIIQLQKIKSFDTAAFQIQKRHLPYFIGAQFNSNIRKTENFIQINWFVLDLDHLYTDIMEEENYKKIFKQDQRIALAFSSPSGDGMKLVFKLSKPITDTTKYAAFYKAFSHEFARHYQVEKFLDFSTSDATRICFLSVDNTAIFNEQPIAVDSQKYISQYDLLEQNSIEVETAVKETKKDLNNDVYKEILQRLNPKTPKKKPDVHVPKALESIMEPIVESCKMFDISVDQVTNISYGKKIKFLKNDDFAELNVFYGKKGFSVVISPKSGHNAQLSDIVKTIVEQVIYKPKPNYVNTHLMVNNAFNNQSLPN